MPLCNVFTDSVNAISENARAINWFLPISFYLRALPNLALQKLPHELGNLASVGFQCEVAGIEVMRFGVGQISLI